MVARIQGRFTRTPVQAADASAPAHDRASPSSNSAQVETEALLAQVRAGIATLQTTQAILDERAQVLLEETSGLYEALQVAATDLAHVRQEQARIAENEEKLQAAAQRLKEQLAGHHDLDHHGPTQPESPADRHDDRRSAESTARRPMPRGLRFAAKPVYRLVAKGRLRKSWLARILTPVLLFGLALTIGGMASGRFDATGRALPVIETVEVSPEHPLAGEPVTIRWNVTGAQTISIPPYVTGLDATAGEYTFSEGFSGGVTLTLMAENESGRDEESLTVSLSRSIGEPIATSGATTTMAEQVASKTPTASAESAATATTIAPTPPPPPASTSTPTTAESTATPPTVQTATLPSATVSALLTPPMAIPTATPTLESAVASCDSPGTSIPGRYCNEIGVFTIWVYACDTSTMTVDWGDGSIEQLEALKVGDQVQHQYASFGRYDVIVTPTYLPANGCEYSNSLITYVFEFLSPS